MIYKCGTVVTLIDANIKGRISTVQIDFEAVSYKIAYFDGLKRAAEWFNECEFTTEVKQVKVGYK